MSFIKDYENENDCFIIRDDNKRAILIAISNLVDSIQRGMVFTGQQIYSIGSASTKYILFDPTEEVPTKITIRDLVLAATSGPAIVNIYIGTDYSGGTAIPLGNRNQRSPNTSSLKLYEDPTGVTKGQLILPILVGTSSSPLFSGGGAANPTIPFVVNENALYLVEIFNNSGEDIDFQIILHIEQER